MRRLPVLLFAFVPALFGAVPARAEPGDAPAEAAPAAPEANAGDADPGAAPGEAASAEQGAPAAEGARASAPEDPRLVALAGLARGALPPDGTVASLFLVDLRDDAAVAARVAALRSELARLDGEPAGDARDAARALAKARLAFLEQPRAARDALLAAEAEGARLSGAAVVAGDQAHAAAAASDAAVARHAEALEAVGGAEDALARLRAERIAGLARSEADLARVRAAEADARVAALARRKEALDASYALTTAVAGGAHDAATWEKVDREWASARAALQGALDALEVLPAEEVAVPAADPGEDAEMAQRRDRLVAERDAAVREERRARLEDAAAAAARSAELVDARGRLLDTPASSGDAVRRISEEGWEALRAEADQIVLQGRWAAVLARDLAAAPGDHLPAVGTTLSSLRAGLALLFTAIAVFLARRSLHPASQLALRSLRSRPGLAAVTSAVAAALTPLARILDDAIPLAAALLVRAWIAPVPGGLGALLLQLGVAFLLYRLAVRVAYESLRWLAGAAEARLQEATSARVLTTVRVLARWALAAWSTVAVARWLVGDGALAALARSVTFAGWGAAGLVVARSWQADVSDAYLRLRPDGGLAAAVRESRGRWYAFFVGAAALGSVAVAAVARAGRRTAMGFDQTRRLLAMLYRRRLESAEVQAPRAPLPADMAAALGARTAPGSAEWVPLARGEAELAEEVRAWRAGERPCGVLVTGVDGVGRTAWLEEAAARIGGGAAWVRLPAPGSPATAVVEAIAAAAGVDGRDPAALGRALAGGGPRVLVVDDLQRLVLRGVGTGAPWRAFATIVRGAGSGVLWLAASTRDAHAWLEWARPSPPVLPCTVPLEPWSETEIGALLRARVRGWGVRFDAVMADALDVAVSAGALLGTEDEYYRLLWDHADGSPRVALACWADSLGVDPDGRPSVRLFQRPDAAWLDTIDGPDRFVLGNVAWHAEVTAGTTAASLGLPEDECRTRLDRLAQRGVLRRDDALYRVDVRWLAATRRFLVRQHLLNP